MITQPPFPTVPFTQLLSLWLLPTGRHGCSTARLIRLWHIGAFAPSSRCASSISFVFLYILAPVFRTTAACLPAVNGTASCPTAFRTLDILLTAEGTADGSGATLLFSPASISAQASVHSSLTALGCINKPLVTLLGHTIYFILSIYFILFHPRRFSNIIIPAVSSALEAPRGDLLRASEFVRNRNR